jgi:hypothetical protein
MLRCEECEATVPEFRPGWSAFWVEGLEDEPRPFLAAYCADCARREFGDWLRLLLSARERHRFQ